MLRWIWEEGIPHRRKLHARAGIAELEVIRVRLGVQAARGRKLDSKALLAKKESAASRFVF